MVLAVLVLVQDEPRTFPKGRLLVQEQLVLGLVLVLDQVLEGLALVLTELRDNAAAHGASELRIEAAESDTIVTLRITDNGSGIPKGNQM